MSTTPKVKEKVAINLRLKPLTVEAIDLAVRLGIAKDRTEFCRDAVKEKLTSTGIWSKLLHGQVDSVSKTAWSKIALMVSEENVEKALNDPEVVEFIKKRIGELEADEPEGSE